MRFQSGRILGTSLLMSTRRHFLAATTVTAAGVLANASATQTPDIWNWKPGLPDLGDRPEQDPRVTVLNPYGRVPVSFIIDDSTCLVNMGHFCMPQFAEAWGKDRYNKPWRDWPREIPDAFVLKFAEWCQSRGVKGKYSVVPYPACVGWVDRVLPGWSRSELRESLRIVREVLQPDWDIHPELISHTRGIDVKTGRPLPQREDGGYWMENGGWTEGKSVDEIAAYIAYGLQILKNVDLTCEGFTTPGGFGNPAKANLGAAAIQALRAVYQVELPHYFKYVNLGDTTTQPRVELASGLDSKSPDCVVNVPCGTGDWFGGWDGVSHGDIDESIDRFVTPDLQAGRMVELIERDEPAVMLCHWPGIYCNGGEQGFRIFQGAVDRLHEGYRDRIRWMKVSEMARYWAAKELTTISVDTDGTLRFQAPFAAPGFTVRYPQQQVTPVVGGQALRKVDRKTALQPGTWLADGADTIACFDLPKGTLSAVHSSM